MGTSVYARIRARLEELGLSDNEASLLATQGRNRDLVRNIKAGRVKQGSAAGMEGLSKVLGRPISWILGEDTDPDRHIRVVPIDAVEGHEIDQRAFTESAPYQSQFPGGVPELADTGGMGEGRVGEVFQMASGGIMSGHRVTAEWAIPPEMTRHFLGADPNSVFILPVDGDSMEPTLKSGDRVLVDPTNKIPRDGGIFVLDEGFGPVVKRCRLLADTDPLEVEIISDNQHVPTIRRPADRVRVIGRVRGRWTRI